MLNKEILITRLKNRLKIIGYIILFSIILILLGFYFFRSNIAKINQVSCNPNHIIIVITGGTGRIESAVRLMNNNCGQLMLISGVNSSFNKSYLQHHFNIEDNKMQQIFLGYEANNTEGNAKEALVFLNLHNKKEEPILLVTNDYHLPRAKLLFKHFIKGRVIESYTIASKESFLADFIEYTKYIGTYVLYKVEFINQIYINYLQAKVSFWRNL